MGALPQPRFNESQKKPPAVETRRDKYGRDPESALERLRASSDYQAETGYAPFFHAALADLPRLASGAVFYAFVLHVNRLSYGRGKDKSGKRITDTLPISAQALADLCACNVRQIQRELGELKDRGVISCKPAKKGEYVISLRYQDWRELEDYSAWKKRQIVIVDDGPEVEPDADEELEPISKDAVHLTRKPETVKPGRATRPKPVKVGVRSFKVQNTGGVDVSHEAVIQSGCLVVSLSSAKGEEKGEDKANVERRARRFDKTSPLESTKKIPDRALEVVSLFDPLLQKSGARLLSPDKISLQSALSELGTMPAEFLEEFVLHPKRGRAARPISGPRAVAAIIREARENWEKVEQQAAAFPVSQVVRLTPEELERIRQREAEDKAAEWERLKQFPHKCSYCSGKGVMRSGFPCAYCPKGAAKQK